MPNEERLRQLRRVVEAAPDDRFYMRKLWGECEGGLAYCAAGWAAVDPWFLENTEIGELFTYKTNGKITVNTTRCRLDIPLAELFDLEQADSNNLFGLHLLVFVTDPHHVTRAEVLENIDLILEGRPARAYPQQESVF